MTSFIAGELSVPVQEANRLRHLYWQEYGATLTGMIKRHGTDPARFLNACHQLDLSGLAPDPRLNAAISALQGRRLIHTNGPRAHAERVLAARGLDALFPEIVAIEDMAYQGKPGADAFGMMLDQTGILPETAVMIEDTADNLAVPHKLGMVTVLVDCPSEPPRADGIPDHVHHHTLDLAAFLEGAGPQPDLPEAS